MDTLRCEPLPVAGTDVSLYLLFDPANETFGLAWDKQPGEQLRFGEASGFDLLDNLVRLYSNTARARKCQSGHAHDMTCCKGHVRSTWRPADDSLLLEVPTNEGDRQDFVVDRKALMAAMTKLYGPVEMMSLQANMAADRLLV